MTRHSSSSSPLGPIANATDVLQPGWLIVLTLSPPPVWTFQRSPPGTPTSPTTWDPSSERWNCVGENWPVILPEIATSTSIQGSLTCRKSVTWDPRLYFPYEGRRAEYFFCPEKSWRLQPGLNPRTWVLKGSTLPLWHRQHATAMT